MKSLGLVIDLSFTDLYKFRHFCDRICLLGPCLLTMCSVAMSDSITFLPHMHIVHVDEIHNPKVPIATIAFPYSILWKFETCHCWASYADAH